MRFLIEKAFCDGNGALPPLLYAWVLWIDVAVYLALVTLLIGTIVFCALRRFK